MLAILKLKGFREQLRRNNLHDTSQIADQGSLPKPNPGSGERYLTARTADGSFNDLERPEMGMAGTRFGRNIPLEKAYGDENNLLNPNPRLISNKLLARDKFQAATTLNLLAVAWIQFQTHDWFGHGDNAPNRKFKIPLNSNDDWPQEFRPMEVRATQADPSRKNGDRSAPATFINEVTHWWDGSQIYGSDPECLDSLRTHVDGKLTMGEDGLLPFDEEAGLDKTGFNKNYWVGLSLLHTLFVKEHNLLCDRLKAQYPKWSDDDLFDHARLINTALMAKIHTLEWTPAILAHPALRIAMGANWWGLLGQKFKNTFGRLVDNDVLSGIIGSDTNHHAAPYYLTEEFVSVYRMHPLIPDEIDFLSLKTGRHVVKKGFSDVFGKQTRPLMQEISLLDLFYSFGVTHPGAITLHNYPNVLRQHTRMTGEVMDLAAVDILRDRERGIPRYNEFRELLGRGRVKSFEEITSNKQWVKELKEVYNNDLESVDTMVGMFAEDLPEGFGFSDTAFRVFILMASRRLKSDRFFTVDYQPEIYTQFGLDWIDKNSILSVLKRHYPELSPALQGVNNAFAPWRQVI